MRACCPVCRKPIVNGRCACDGVVWNGFRGSPDGTDPMRYSYTCMESD
jgi:hypothetical protein